MSLSHSLTPAPQSRFSLPLIGPLSRAISQDINLIFYVMVILLTVVVLAVKTWGLAALTLSALALVPVIFALLILTTLP